MSPTLLRCFCLVGVGEYSLKDGERKRALCNKSKKRPEDNVTMVQVWTEYQGSDEARDEAGYRNV